MNSWEKSAWKSHNRRRSRQTDSNNPEQTEGRFLKFEPTEWKLPLWPDELCSGLQASISRQFRPRRHQRNRHGEPGEAAGLSGVPGDVLQTCGHPALPAQPLPQVCQWHLPGGILHVSSMFAYCFMNSGLPEKGIFIAIMQLAACLFQQYVSSRKLFSSMLNELNGLINALRETDPWRYWILHLTTRGQSLPAER